MSESDKPGSFYLGKEFSLARSERLDGKIVYDSKHLTTHAVCVGMTGSGKTGLCLSLLEEAALDGIPAIAIDPKGDLGNLLLAFPEFRATDFEPWVEAREAEQRGLSREAYAQQQADLWKRGLTEWGRAAPYIQRFHDFERVIYTPGSSAGIPITVLKSFHAPAAELLADDDELQDQIASAASGLLGLLGIDADPVRSREHILFSRLIEKSWRAGRDLDLLALIRQIRKPDEAGLSQIGAVSVDQFYPPKERDTLAMALNSLLGSPSFASWLTGEPLDIGKLLYTPAGKPRLAIVSIAHLDDAQRMFIVTMLLNEVLAWARTQSGTSSLRAILYMDEVFGYFPPLANPPSKRPMLTLLKQARAYGLGCMLATQNPVDLDYKGLSNAGTWFLGRLQTERDKARVMDGLEGASAQAGSTFNRREMEAMLAALGNRVFLMNDVNEDAPKVFQTRWAMSYLRGPLTRDQVKLLMDPLRDKFADSPTNASDGGKIDLATKLATSRPVLPSAIHEVFAALVGRVPDGYRLEYRPGLLGRAKVKFLSAKDGIDSAPIYHLLQAASNTPPDDVWHKASNLPEPLAVDAQPDALGTFAELPAELARERSYGTFRRQLEDHLYQRARLQLWRCVALGTCSHVEETEVDFRQRLAPELVKAEAAARVECEQRFAKQQRDLDSRIQKAEARVNAQRWQFWTRVTGVIWVVIETLMRLWGVGRAGRPRSPDVALRGMATERGQQATAQVDLDKLLAEQESLVAAQDKRLAELATSFKPETVALERFEIKPFKRDIVTEPVVLAWLPYRVNGEGVAEAVYELPQAAPEGDDAADRDDTARAAADRDVAPVDTPKPS